MATFFRLPEEYLNELAVEDHVRFQTVIQQLCYVVEKGGTFRRSRDVTAAILNTLTFRDGKGVPCLPPRFAEFRQVGTTPSTAWM
jgi:hypothetical protein